MGRAKTPAATWRNWAGNQRADGVTVVRPRGTGEIVDAVVRARDAGERLRPIGSGHSFTAIGRPDQRQLVLDRHADLVGFDGTTGLVTVPGGMPLRRLNELLSLAGFALTNLGDIDVQTVAGAVSTGTHGTGEAFGGIATQIRALELVTADGLVLSCSPDDHADVFSAARVGLGALGVISTVTLQAEPAFALRAEEGPMDLVETLDRFDELAATSDHFEFYWFPHTSRTLTKCNTRMPLDELDPLPRWRYWLDDELLSNSLYGTMVAFGHRWPTTIPTLNRFAARALGPRTYTDRSHVVFTSPRRVRFVEMEYAVPRETVVHVVTELRRAVEANGWRIPVPVEVRVAAADDIPLSTAYGRDTAYVAVHTEPGSVDTVAYFRTLEQIAGEVGGRPHWGKLHHLGASTLRDRYPRFDEFVALRDRLDPQGLFTNDYLDEVLGSVSQGVPAGRTA